MPESIWTLTSKPTTPGVRRYAELRLKHPEHGQIAYYEAKDRTNSSCTDSCCKTPPTCLVVLETEELLMTENVEWYIAQQRESD